MKARITFFVLLVGALVLAFHSIASAVVDTRGVDEVLKKSVLTPQDLVAIDEFVLDVAEEIVQTDDFTQIAATRAIILSRQGTQNQYVQQFSESVGKHIPEKLQEAQGVADPVRRFEVMTNLLILVDGLKDPRLADTAIRMIPQENNSVRYWAVRAVTDPGLWAKINRNQAAAAQLADRIIAECGRVVETSSPEVVNLMVDFAGRFNTPGAETLLMRAADERIRRYAAWDTGYELADGAILKLLCNRLATGGTPNPELARRFAQLYSFVIQRYIKGQQQNVLSGASIGYLVAVIVEVEDKCLSKLLGVRQPTLTQSIQAANLDALQAEHDKLLGGTGQTGALVSKLNFTYGTGPGNRAAPSPLPDPPAPVTPSAPTLATRP
ncbi:MAG: hypothetical protein JW955_21635 [Sedimentisphaerales bacterium]|nr:hypothetical protein [Sedimentisphaerales bacterium]